MYKKIMVPLDGSERAEAILPHVVELARCMDSEVILLRVYTTDFGQVDDYGHDPEFYEAIRAECKEKIRAYLIGLQNEHLNEGLKAKVLAEEGSVVGTILDTADREGVDLIAMSSHGRTGLARVFYGSVAAGVLCQANRPLLLIRAV
jgi:nucleotide-binding universal stress UspA family protein